VSELLAKTWWESVLELVGCLLTFLPESTRFWLNHCELIWWHYFCYDSLWYFPCSRVWSWILLSCFGISDILQLILFLDLNKICCQEINQIQEAAQDICLVDFAQIFWLYSHQVGVLGKDKMGHHHTSILNCLDSELLSFNCFSWDICHFSGSRHHVGRIALPWGRAKLYKQVNVFGWWICFVHYVKRFKDLNDESFEKGWRV